jgi:tRNA modification GTPase
MGEKDSSTAADQVVVTVAQVTPVPWVEVHCHGGIEVVRWLMEILEAQGCKACSWPELERAATTEPWKTAATLELVKASTVRTAAILLDQYHGAFAKAFTEIELALSKNNIDEATRSLEALARYAGVGRHLTAPWKVAVIGPPNVGKSSLVNALAGYQRSIVASTPGTTRDLVTTLIAVDGWPVEVIDTAGLHDEAESLEGQGISLARRAAVEADLCLWILDASEPPIWPELELRENKKVKLVVNKTDLLPVWDIQQSSGLHVSARTGAGLAELVEALARWLVPDPPPPGAAVPFTSAVPSQVEEALALTRAGRVQNLTQIFLQLATESA